LLSGAGLDCAVLVHGRHAFSINYNDLPDSGYDAPSITVKTGVNVDTGNGDLPDLDQNTVLTTDVYQFRQVAAKSSTAPIELTIRGDVTIETQFVFHPTLVTLTPGSSLHVHAGQALWVDPDPNELIAMNLKPNAGGMFLEHQLPFTVRNGTANIVFETTQVGDIIADDIFVDGSPGLNSGGNGGNVVLVANRAMIQARVSADGGSGNSADPGSHDGCGGNGGTIAVAACGISDHLGLFANGGNGEAHGGSGGSIGVKIDDPSTVTPASHLFEAHGGGGDSKGWAYPLFGDPIYTDGGVGGGPGRIQVILSGTDCDYGASALPGGVNVFEWREKTLPNSDIGYWEAICLGAEWGSGSPPAAVAIPEFVPLDTWTIMVYANADIEPELEKMLIRVLDKFENVNLNGLPINVVVQMDRRTANPAGEERFPFSWTDTRRGLVTYDNDKGHIRSVLLPVTDPVSGILDPLNPNNSEWNAGDSNELNYFIKWAAGVAPAEHYALIVQGHGQGVGGLMPDYTSADAGIWPSQMGLHGFGKAIADSQVPIDLVAVQCCNEETVELATELRGKTRYLVASQSTLGSNYGTDSDGNFTDSEQWLSWLANLGVTDAGALAQEMVKVYGFYTYSALDVNSGGTGADGVTQLNQAIKAFTDYVLSQPATWTEWDLFHHCRADAFDGSYGAPYQCDLGNFMTLVMKRSSSTDVCDLARNVVEKISALVIKNGGSYQDDPSTHTTGLSVYFPLEQDLVYYPAYFKNLGTTYPNEPLFDYVTETNWNLFLSKIVPTSPKPLGLGLLRTIFASNAPELQGTVNDPSVNIRIAVDQSIYTATNNEDGTWTLPGTVFAKPLADGNHDVTITAVDMAGNPLVEPVTSSLLIDTLAPTSQVNPLPSIEPSTSFTVGWSGIDDAGGSGVSGYDIHVSDNGGAYALWLDNTTDISATFTGQDGHAYAFYSVATDNVGHQEELPTTPDAQTTVSVPNLRPSVSATTSSGTKSGAVAIVYSLLDPESDSCSIVVEYSADGGATWKTASNADGQGDGQTGLAASASGVQHTFVWASRFDMPNKYSSNVTLRITPRDAGGSGTTATTAAFAIDNRASQPPTISGIVVAEAGTPKNGKLESGESLKITWAASSDHGIASQTMTVDARQFKPIGGPYGGLYYSCTIGTWTTGTHAYTIKTTDAKGASSVSTGTFKILGPTPPNITGVVVAEAAAPKNGKFEPGEKLKLTWAAASASGIASQTVTIDGKAIKPISGPYGGLYYSCAIGAFAAGSHSYTIAATGKNGGKSTSTGQFNVTAGPSICAVKVSTASLSVSINWKIYAPGGVKSYALTIDGNAVTVVPPSAPGTGYTGTTGSLAAGTHNYVITVTDNAGRVATFASSFRLPTTSSAARRAVFAGTTQPGASASAKVDWLSDLDDVLDA
jgi:hypothetical protein